MGKSDSNLSNSFATNVGDQQYITIFCPKIQDDDL